jgi:hypothetical protein
MATPNARHCFGECRSFFPVGIAKLLLVLIAIAYGLQVASPLRINTDSYRLLSMALSAAEGQGYLVEGQPDQFPNGYPYLVKVCLEAGVANSAALIGMNLLFFSIGLFVLWGLAYRIQGSDLALLAVLWVASSWLIVKHATLPLSDAGYFAFSMGALFCLWKFYHSHFPAAWPWLLPTLVLIFLSLQFRTVGITLLPAAAVSIALHSDLQPFWTSLAKHLAKIAWSLAMVGGVASVCFFWVLQTEWFSSQFLAKGSYFQSMLGYFERHGILGFIVRNIGFRLREMGEIVANFPENKAGIFGTFFYALGFAGWILVALGAVWMLRRGMLPLVAYLLAYFGLMMAWPYYDTRFWIPLLPIFALAVWGMLLDFSTNKNALRLGLAGIFACHFILGSVALAFSTRISLSGSMVGEFFGDESTRMTYREAFQNGLPVESELVHSGKVRILKIFEPLSKD